MGVRVIVFSRQGAPIVDVTAGTMPKDDGANVAGVLSILEPMSQKDSEYLFTMTLGPFHIDVYFANDRYAFSIIPANSKPNLLGLNAFFAWAVSRCFSSLVSGRDEKEEQLPQQLLEAFQAMIPEDPLVAVGRAIDSLMIAGVRYISFVAEGHRVLLSLGETKMPPEDFIFAWCAAMEAGEELPGKPWVGLEDYDNVAIAQFLPCVKVVVFFEDKAVTTRVDYFIGELEKVKLKLADVFETEELKPQMPQVPKSGPRRPGRH